MWHCHRANETKEPEYGNYISSTNHDDKTIQYERNTAIGELIKPKEKQNKNKLQNATMMTHIETMF